MKRNAGVGGDDDVRRVVGVLQAEDLDQHALVAGVVEARQVQARWSISTVELGVGGQACAGAAGERGVDRQRRAERVQQQHAVRLFDSGGPSGQAGQHQQQRGAERNDEGTQRQGPVSSTGEWGPGGGSVRRAGYRGLRVEGKGWHAADDLGPR